MMLLPVRWKENYAHPERHAKTGKKYRKFDSPFTSESRCARKKINIPAHPDRNAKTGRDAGILIPICRQSHDVITFPLRGRMNMPAHPDRNEKTGKKCRNFDPPLFCQNHDVITLYIGRSKSYMDPRSMGPEM